MGEAAPRGEGSPARSAGLVAPVLLPKLLLEQCHLLLGREFLHVRRILLGMRAPGRRRGEEGRLGAIPFGRGRLGWL